MQIYQEIYQLIMELEQENQKLKRDPYISLQDTKKVMHLFD